MSSRLPSPAYHTPGQDIDAKVDLPSDLGTYGFSEIQFLDDAVSEVIGAVQALNSGTRTTLRASSC